ncbi:UNVERIFIED_CONTAM: hypothetical protein HDU68_006743 [Siphonaria sp. JEL0065]|nr:hypothetical protein HDU68_006743 [Siphonaria sp. JEL0065]
MILGLRRTVAVARPLLARSGSSSVGAWDLEIAVNSARPAARKAQAELIEQMRGETSQKL